MSSSTKQFLCKEEFEAPVLLNILCIATDQSLMVTMTGPINFGSKDRKASFKRRELDDSNNGDEPDHRDEVENVALVVEESMKFKSRKIAKLVQQTIFSFKNFPLAADSKNVLDLEKKLDGDSPKQQANSFPSRAAANDDHQLDTAATKLQKFYKSYRTRRNLADCAVVIEELWWKQLDFAALRRSSVSFFNSNKRETAVSRWERAKTRAAKVGKGLSKDEKAQNLALRHWLEAIDPRHRYGHNLHLYYEVWLQSESNQPFFYWLDIGEGKEVNLDSCPRTNLQNQCIKYLGPKEREAYEVVMENGKLVYRRSRVLVDTLAPENSKWIFVLSSSRDLYVGQKIKGKFQHSSFLAGGATIASGRLVVRNGILEAAWPFSGHYHPTEESFMEFCSFLEDRHIDLTNVKKSATDEDAIDIPPEILAKRLKESETNNAKISNINSFAESEAINKANEEHANKDITAAAITHENDEKLISKKSKEPAAKVVELGKQLSRKWTTGAGPRISCVRDYPTQLQVHALEQVNLSPSGRVKPGPFTSCGPIPSPRPSPNVLLSPRLTYIGLSNVQLSPVN